jgi:hypothetical protein
MAVTRPTYCTREEVRAAPDVTWSPRANPKIDRAIQDAAERVEGQLHRVFYNTDTIRYWDWPNFQYAYPWRLWLDQWEIADITVNVPVVTSGGIVIPAEACNWEPINSGPPFNYLELRRDLSYSFGNGPTPQRDIGIQATYGHWVRASPAGQLAAAVADTTSTTITVTDSTAAGVGDNITVDSERMLLTDKAMVTTGQTQLSGLSTAQNNDQTLGVTDGGEFSLFETLLIDSERVLITDIAGNNLTVQRAYDGTTLAAHTGATIYAPRQWTVVRGAQGATAATHANGAAISLAIVPGLIKDYSLAETLVQLKNEPAAFALSQGSGPSKQGGIGGNLPDLRDQALAKYGRKARQRAI